MGPLPFEVMLLKERASALGHAGSELEKALDKLRAFEAELDKLSGEAKAKRASEHKALRAQAEKRLWYLLIQREAMGIRRHEEVFATYRVPEGLSCTHP